MYQNYAIPHFSGDMVFERMSDLRRAADAARQAKLVCKSEAARHRLIRFEWPAFLSVRRAHLDVSPDAGC
jgi:hypothetical protein